MLLALVVAEKLTIQQIRRKRKRRGQKGCASLTPQYFRDYKAKRRALAITAGDCVHCFADRATPGMRTCLGCRKARKPKMFPQTSA